MTQDEYSPHHQTSTNLRPGPEVQLYQGINLHRPLASGSSLGPGQIAKGHYGVAEWDDVALQPNFVQTQEHNKLKQLLQPLEITAQGSRGLARERSRRSRCPCADKNATLPVAEVPAILVVSGTQTLWFTLDDVTR
ncbi:hypothetical protein N7540_008740 [Penicillium herquei]|nr:hypothetical protein N7540_008740 [Penicillium herquei]